MAKSLPFFFAELELYLRQLKGYVACDDGDGVAHGEAFDVKFLPFLFGERSLLNVSASFGCLSNQRVY